MFRAEIERPYLQQHVGEVFMMLPNAVFGIARPLHLVITASAIQIDLLGRISAVLCFRVFNLPRHRQKLCK